MHTGRLLVLLGGLLLVVGARLPWVSWPVLFGFDDSVSRALEIGWEDNGYFTGAIGIVLLLTGLLKPGKAGRRYSILLGVVFAGYAILVVLGCFQRIIEINPADGFFAATDIGIYITLVGALLALAGTLWRVPGNDQDASTVPGQPAIPADQQR